MMYLYDPQLGRRRRALTRDRLINLEHQIDDAVDVTTRDFSNRAAGLWAEMRSCMTSNAASDEC